MLKHVARGGYHGSIPWPRRGRSQRRALHMLRPLPDISVVALGGFAQSLLHLTFDRRRILGLGRQGSPLERPAIARAVERSGTSVIRPVCSPRPL